MGRVQHGSRTKGSAKSQLKTHKTKRYTRDLDQIALDMNLAHAIRNIPGSAGKVPATFGGTNHATVTGVVDEETVGMGKWPCVECARFFADELSLKGHVRGKPHKRRVKELKAGAYTHEEAMRAGDDQGPTIDNVNRSLPCQQER